MRSAFAVALFTLALHGQDADFFERHVRPVLANRCYSCHSTHAKTPFAGLRLDSRAAVLRGGDHGPAIVVGNPEASRLIQAIRGQTKLMPPTGKLPAAEVAALEHWVATGAFWPAEPEPGAASPSPGSIPPSPGAPAKTLWSLEPVRAIAPSSIDELVRAKLAAHHLRLSPPADPTTLRRRLAYDLTGLPPDPDLASIPYEQAVDRLLASPHFGERWGRYWLDLVRFADAGFNNVRFPFAYAYRDWVVNAINADMPYDRFIHLQLAADHLNEPSHLPALGLLALGHNSPRVDAIPERVDDRIDVVTRTVLGLTVSCARCHDHKYDPIPTRDYYALYGVFANTVETEPQPLSSLNSPLDRFYLPKLASRLDTILAYKRERIEEIRAEARQPDQVKRYLLVAWETRAMTAPQVENLSRERNVNHLILERWRAWLEPNPTFHPANLDTVVAQLISSGYLLQQDAPPTVPLDAFAQVQTEGDFNTVNNLSWQRLRIYADYALRGAPLRAQAVADRAHIEPAFVFRRGNMNDLGEPVARQFLSAVAPRSVPFHTGSGRLDLARTLTHPDNPLTPRVMANRVWQRLFGEGLVRTVSDFGFRGEAPTHPELLDYLAARFRQHWSLKRLIREIVLSDVYRQSSADNPAFRQRDPENRQLWRQNRRRLDFEALRDSMLVAAGRLDRRIGGAPFSLGAVPSVGRRTLYAYVERERANPLLKSFNFADPEQHTAERHATTVPQQGLFLLNSPFIIEQARALAQRSPEVGSLYRHALGRLPTPAERKRAERFLQAGSTSSATPAASSPWQLGYGHFDPAAGRVKAFHRFRYFTGTAWQASSLLPDPIAGNAFLTATGGAPGDNLETAVIRRWVSPVAGTIDIDGALSHALNQFEQRFHLTNGIRGWVVSSRHGVLASWTFDPPEPRTEFKASEVRKVETRLNAVTVQPGDTIDFVVDSRDDYESDDFQWAPTIRCGNQTWTAAEGFAPPPSPPLTAWEQLAQVLLLTNEFAFVD
jgi:hypothetical protein